MTTKTTLFILTFLTVINCFGQTESSKKRTPSIYSNWMSLDYINCLKTDLPCACEKSSTYFLISLDTINKFVSLYDGRANYDYNRYSFRMISKHNLEVYNKPYSPTLIKDSIDIIGQIKIENDTLLFTDPLEKQTQFILYSTGDADGYYKEHINLLNSALTNRGYDNFNTMLQSELLKCWCNWELDGGINIIFGPDKDWVLEKKEDELYIYEWINPPSEKTIDLKIEKKLLKKLQW